MIKLPVQYLAVSSTLLILMGTTQPLRALTNTTVQNEQCQTFRETGKTVCGRFLDFWKYNGDIRLFGFAISDPISEVSELDGRRYTVQYFERAVFEMHPENKPPYDVLLAHVGTYRFASKYPNGYSGPPYTDNLPLYPNAKNVQVSRTNVTSIGGVMNTTTYDTDAKVDDVRAFYKDAMERNRWSLRIDEPNSLRFVYAAGPEREVYGLQVDLSKITLTRTSVRLRLIVEPPGR